METTKRLYEGLFLIDSGLAASQWDQMLGTIRRFLDRAEAQVISLKKWDERKLAYDIKGKSRGTYILAYFECDPLRISGIERDVTLSEQILRVMILRTDEKMNRDEIDKPTPAELAERGEQRPAEGQPDVTRAKVEDVPAAEASAAQNEQIKPKATGAEKVEPEQA